MSVSPTYLHPLCLPATQDGIPLPERFTYPFAYTPHPLAVAAADQVRAYLTNCADLTDELSAGKMLGVLVLQDLTLSEHQAECYGTIPLVSHTSQLYFLAAYSGTLMGHYDHPWFVPPIYNSLRPSTEYSRLNQDIVILNHEIDSLEHNSEYLHLRQHYADQEKQIAQRLEQLKSQCRLSKSQRDERRKEIENLPAEQQPALLEALIRESQHAKAELHRAKLQSQEQLNQLRQQLSAYELQLHEKKELRRHLSSQLQEQLFSSYHILNARHESVPMTALFDTLPPSGSGDCCAPKLLNAAYLLGDRFKPICMAEFWMGRSPIGEVRHDGQYYPACRSKCRPLLRHMLAGLVVDDNPLLSRMRQQTQQLKILYEDDTLVMISKPSGMLSVPGTEDAPSVAEIMRQRYPQASGPMIVHRLDMDTSGVMVIALTNDSYINLQSQFATHKIRKKYIAVLESQPIDNQSGRVLSVGAKGTIDLPLCVNPLDRPRQMVDFEHGKRAITDYEVLDDRRIALYPRTGRTHQLRMHMAIGLCAPIMGDSLYGQVQNERLMLHACELSFVHPQTHQPLCFQDECPF